MISCVYINPALFSSNQDQDSTVSDDFSQETPEDSITGNHPWWEPSFRSRQLINITNPYSESFENFGVSFSFNYADLVAEGKLNESLKDVRIIEYIGDDPFIRKYYFLKDYPTNDIATIWFDTNVTATDGSTETDTYLYYGDNNAEILTSHFMNQSSDSAADNFGWIRNGNFELEDKPGTLIDDVFGWYWSDDVPDDVYDPVSLESNYQHNLSTYTGEHEQVYEGTYSFKWGDTAHRVDSGGDGEDFIGTLFCTPFVVPKVSGGSNKIYIKAWRNIRVYDHGPKYMKYYLKISNNFNEDVNIGHESYPSTTYSSGHVENWQSIGKTVDETVLKDNFLVLDDADTGIAGELTGIINIDVTDYQGETIFLEFIMFGEENNVEAFGQIDDVRFNYTLDATLNPEIEERRADVTIITRDIDGRIVPNAEVSIVNMSRPSPILDTKNTSLDDASVIFTGLDYGTYNITVNYTIPNTGIETTVYDSSLIGGSDFTLYETSHNFTIVLDIWTIDFEIVDSSKEPLNYGFINIYNNTDTSEFLDNLTLDPDGKATFRWKNQTSYYYEVYYNNVDYNLNPILLNESCIYRHNYDNVKYVEHTLNVNQTNTATGDFFSVSEYIYTNGSTTLLSNKKIIKANITLTGMDAHLDDVSIYYIDKYNSTPTEDDRIYYNNSYTDSDDSDFIQIDIREPPINPINLKSDSYEVFGLLIEINGQNSTQCNGTIKIDLFETTNIYNITALSKVNIRVTDSFGTPITSNCFVEINGTTSEGFFETTLETNDLGDGGYAFGQINTEIPFWFLNGYEYNFSLNFLGLHQNLIVNKTEPLQWEPGTDVDVYYFNYTVEQASNLTFELYMAGDLNISTYKTKFESMTLDEEVIWGENITVQVNFYSTTDDWGTSEPVNPPAEVICSIKATGPGSTIIFSLDMEPGAEAGIYSVTFNTSRLSAGTRGEIYSIIISGSKPGYSDPGEKSETTFIDAVSTILTMHDYYDSLTEISDFSQTFGEYINLTVKYYNDINSPLKGATLSYEWLSMDPILFYEDPNNEGYYTATINTTIAEIWGVKSIKVTASLENYSIQTLITSIDIEKRPTSLNGLEDLVYISSKVWVEDPHNFTYEYKDLITGNLTGDLEVAIYSWQKMDEYGEPIPGIDGTGFLTQNENKVYTLDFKTGIKSIGFYFLYVNLYKQNYEERAALINLEIMYREFEVELNTTHLDGNQISVAQGDDVEFILSLIDLTRNNISLEGASVVLNINNAAYALTEASPGAYTLNFSTADIDTYFGPQPLTGVLTIRKANFTSQEMTITIIVQMEEIFPGMPAFYFILITASIIGVAGSLIAYRVVQQARIPKFVKKIRKVKGKIKSKKPISESYAIKTKEQMMLKLFEEDWKALDLSLEDMLGTRDLKLKTNSLKEKKSKIGGDRD